MRDVFAAPLVVALILFEARSPRVSCSRKAKVCSAIVTACAPRMLVTTTSLSARPGTRHIHSTPALGDCTQRSFLRFWNSSSVSIP